MNEKSYYNRMSKSLKDKEQVIVFVKNGDNFLDFGAGTGDIHKSVFSKGANYYALDNSEQSVKLLKAKRLNVFKSIAELKKENIQFNVIYLSSVLHEIFSYSKTSDNLKETISVFKELFDILTTDGLIIIRDFPKPDYNIELTLKINKKYKKLFNNHFISGFKNNKLIDKYSTNVIIKETDNSIIIKGNARYIFEIMYHFNWGLQSFERENKEIYGLINKKTLESFSDTLNYEILYYNEYFSEDYRHFLEDKFQLTKEKEEIEWLNNKFFTVLKKSKLINLIN